MGRGTALLLLAAVLAMHGLPAVTAVPGWTAGVSAVALTGPPPMTGSAAAPHGARSHAAEPPATGPGATVPAAAASAEDGGDHGPAPHDPAGHLWTLCLAVLSAALAAVLSLLLAGAVPGTGPVLPRARLRLPRWLVPPRPPDLSSLCLLRI